VTVKATNFDCFAVASEAWKIWKNAEVPLNA
jgi:hypothetical protein